MPESATQDLWVSRVLSVTLDRRENTAAKLTRGNEAAKPRGIAYRKMLLKWRDAQAKVESDMASVSRAILARTDVQHDPRFEQVKQLVASLPKLIPAFGEKLGDVLDAAMSAERAADAERLAADAVQVIAGYRRQLGAAKPLMALDDLLSKEGQKAAMHRSLDEALAALQAELSSAA